MTYPTLREQQEAIGASFDANGQVNDYGDALREYHAALEGAAVMDARAHGRLWMSNRDRAALLQRLSTNDVERLQPGQGTQTVLTNHNGRIIDLLTVHVPDDRLLVVTSPGQRGPVRSLIRKNIFFNDKVGLEDASQELGQLALYGPNSAALLSTLFEQSFSDLPLYGIAAAVLGDVGLWIARTEPLGGAGWSLFAPTAAMSDLWTALTNAGAQPLGAAAFDVLRVEAGYGAFGRELSLEYIPLETGLRRAISFTKGCYVGQEIIARMDSRGRMAKVLRGLKLSALPSLTDERRKTKDEGPDEQTAFVLRPSSFIPSAKLAVNGKEAGDLTSVVQSPRFGSIALAYVRSVHADPGTVVGIDGSDVTGEVITLPFID